MMNIQAALVYARDKIPTLEAEVLLAHILQKPRSYLLAYADKEMAAEAITQYQELVTRHASGEPVAYLIGSREFWSLEIEVTRDTLIPRPETELIVEWVLKKFSDRSHLKLADLGTGSGAIALALAKEKPSWKIIATDISDRALKIARKNAQRLGLPNIDFYQGSWCTALPCFDFDVIVSNPPYVAEAEWEIYEKGLKFEPKGALLAGFDGLRDLRNISESVKKYLNPQGYVVVEHGFLQGKSTRALFLEQNFKEIMTIEDGAGHERITIGQNHDCKENVLTA